MIKNSPPRAPAGLSAASRQIWKRITSAYDIQDVGGQETLRVGLEALDRCQSCRAIIDRDGEIKTDRFGQPKPHPLLAAERDARAQYLAALKALNLDVPAAQQGGRASPSADPSGGSRDQNSPNSPSGIRRIY